MVESEGESAGGKPKTMEVLMAGEVEIEKVKVKIEAEVEEVAAPCLVDPSPPLSPENYA